MAHISRALRSLLCASAELLLAVSVLAAGAAWAQAPTSVESTAAPGTVLRDCADCPELVVVPAGSVRLVSIDQPFAVGRFEVTRAEYARFVAESDYRVGNKCFVFEAVNAAGAGVFNWRDGKSWRDPGYSQTERDPVVCTSWEDAHAYIAWLSGITSRAYRLLSSAEWIYVASAGTGQLPWWAAGDSSCLHSNSADLAFKQRYPTLAVSTDCDDGFAFTAPVGRFKANPFGLYDLLGNAWEWTEDCGGSPSDDAASNGQPMLTGNCQNRVRRSGSWFRPVDFHSSALPKGEWHGNAGFRVARALD